MKQEASLTQHSFPELKANVAGLDIGADEIYGAIHKGNGEYEVRHFPTFTEDLHLLTKWLLENKIVEVAMESTGVYWIPVFQILEASKISVCLVNARHLRNVPGRKTDVSDSIWLQRLFCFGLLRASFRPDQQICSIRSIMRHRANLVEQASSHVQRMQKSLTQMNVLLHNVISDIVGKSGLAILDSILAGERDRNLLASMCDRRIHATKQEVAKSLEGDYRAEHLFTLRQSLQLYRSCLTLIAECDRELERLMADITPPDPPSEPLPKSSKSVRTDGKAMVFKETDARTEFYRLFGTDLTLVPSIGLGVIATLLSEVGYELSAFERELNFSSWLGMCPGSKISGGKILSSKTRKVMSRLSHVLRIAAQGLRRSKTHLGDYYRKMCARLGNPGGVTATAHKLAQIIYHLITTKTAYDEKQFTRNTERNRLRAENKLRQSAASLGYDLIKAAPTA